MRAGDAVEDFCRACKTDRMHIVIAADAAGRPLRVACGFCRSEHNFRGGPRIAPSGPAAENRPAPRVPAESPRPGREPSRGGKRTDSAPLVSERETSRALVMVPGADMNTDLELLLRRIIREETGLTPVAPAEKWRNGTLVLRAGTPGLQEKSWPIETFFHKIVMIRNRLRSLEQQVNAADLPTDVKLKLQSYISGCYGSLTSFNVLFADEDDQFKGSGEGQQ
jgi:hypothetical protein